MANEIVRPAELPPRATPVASEIIASDNGSVVGGVTWTDGVNAGRPLANQVEAETGVNATKAMTPLTTKQAIGAQVPSLISTAINNLNLGTASQQPTEAFATAAQGAKADSAVQPARSITAGTGLTGGGDLSADRTVSLSSASIGSLGRADTAMQPSMYDPNGNETDAFDSANQAYDNTDSGLASSTAQDAIDELADRDVIHVSTRAALADYAGTKTPSALVLGEGGSGGEFVWQTGNFSSGVAADPTKSMFVPSPADPTGSLGVWARRNEFAGGFTFGISRRTVHLSWFGMGADKSAAENTAAFNAFKEFCYNADGCLGIFPAGVLNINALVIDRSGMFVEGHRHGTWLVNNTPSTPAIYILGVSGKINITGVARLRIGQAAGVAAAAGNVGVRVENTSGATVEDISVIPFPGAIYRGFYFTDADLTNASGLVATGCLDDGFVFANGCTDTNGGNLKSMANAGNGFRFAGVSGFYANQLIAYGNDSNAFLFAEPTSGVNQFFMVSNWVGDTSGNTNWQAVNLNRSVFTGCWGSTQKSAAVNTTAGGLVLSSPKCYDIDFVGFQASYNNSNGALLLGGARGIRLTGGRFGSPVATGHGNGRAGSGSGVRMEEVYDCIVQGVRCEGNASSGLLLTAQPSDYNIITGNNLRGNTGTNLVNQSTGTNNVLANNIV